MSIIEIEELLKSTSLEDVILGIKIAHNLYGEEYFKKMKIGTSRIDYSEKIIQHNLDNHTDKYVVFSDYYICISSVNIWYSCIKFPGFDNIVYDDRF